MKKKITLIVGGGILLIFFFLIAIGGSKSPEAAATPSATEPIPQTAKVFSETPATNEPLAQNATLNLSDKIAKQLLEKNPNGPSLLNGTPSINAKNPQALVEQIIQQELANADMSSLRPVVSVSELKLDTSKDPSLAAFRDEFVKAVTPFFSLATGPNPTPALFASFTASADETLVALKDLKTPASLAPLMAKEIELITYNRNIFAAVANADNDPFRALLALQIWGNARQEFGEAHLALMAKLPS